MQKKIVIKTLSFAKKKFVKKILRVERCVPDVSRHYLEKCLSEGSIHSLVNHHFNRIEVAYKKVLGLKNKQTLQHIILL